MNRLTHLLPLVLCLFSWRCEESLPPREEPRDFLRATIEALPGPVVIQDSVAARTDGGFYIELKNLFDEVLQDSALVQARIEIWLKDNPAQRGLAIADERNLVNGRIVSLGLTTLDVDSAAKFIMQWNHRTNEGIPFWSLVPLHQRFTPLGIPYCESDPMRFVAQASVQVFKHVQAQKTSEIEFSLVYQVFGIQCE
jgi:hypothetical protein